MSTRKTAKTPTKPARKPTNPHPAARMVNSVVNSVVNSAAKASKRAKSAKPAAKAVKSAKTAKSGKLGKLSAADQGRVDLAASLRWAARLGLNEGVCNHFSLELAPNRYLINPQGMHWSEVRAADILLIDGSGKILEGKHALEPTAFFIHSHIHRANPHAKCVMHTHMPYATALTLVEGGRLEWCNQNTLRFWNRVGYDDVYNGVALEAAEGERIAAQLKGKDVMFMASHGVTVVGATVAWTFDDLYYLERACMHQVLATQAAGRKPLRRVPDELCALVGAQIAGERQQSDLFFDSIKRLLTREDPGWARL